MVSGCRNFIEAIWGRAASCNGNLWLEKLQCKAIQGKGGPNVRENYLAKMRRRLRGVHIFTQLNGFNF